MASKHDSTIDSFEFSSYIDEELHPTAELVEGSSSITTPANTSEELNDNAKSSVAPHEALRRHEFRKSEGTVTNGRTVLQTPGESSEYVAEPVKRPLPIASLRGRNRSVRFSSGINPENLIDAKISQSSPPTSTTPSSSYSLRNRMRSKLVYDVKYHPMDDAIRPGQAAKRRSAHGEIPLVESEDISDASTLSDTDAGAEELSDSDSEEEKEMPRQSKKAQGRKQTKARPLPTEGTRRSKRKVSDKKTSYNMDIHPQDKYLVISSDEERPTPSNKHRKLTHKRPSAEDDSESDNEVAKRPKTSDQKRSLRTDPETSDSIDSSGTPVFPSVETGNESKHIIASATTSYLPLINSPPGHGIRRREGIDVWHYPPGKRYLNHDRDYWPTLPDLPFEIFHEKLEDQLAREAMEASPLNHEHDNKENLSNAGLEPPSDDHDGISIMPSAQYRQSGHERQSENHRALVSDALYSDEAPQSYGLDGTHGICEVQKDVPTEYMDILVSGGHLPPGPTHVGAQSETPDSVLDSDFISDIRASEL